MRIRSWNRNLIYVLGLSGPHGVKRAAGSLLYVFDQSLLRWALQAGVELQLNSKVAGVSPAGSHVDVRCAGRADPTCARACILANGASYGLQAEMGLGMPPVRLNSAQVELPAASPGDVEIFFGSSVAPQGFAWIAPVVRPSGYYARIGLMCEGNGALYFEKLLDRVAGRWGLDIRLPITPRLKLLPLSPIRKTYGDRLLVIGDAAGLVKPTTGGGLYYSVLSASVASDVLAEALLRDDLGEAALREYETRWRGRLQEELEAQLTLRLLAQRLTDADIEQLFQLASTDGLIPLIRQTVQFNEHRDLVAALLKYPATRKILFRKLLGR